MINYEEKVLQNVVKQFDGMSKLQAYDILHKIEGLLRNFNTPLEFREIQKSIKKSIMREHLTPIGDSGYCYLEDECQYIRVYSLKSLFPPLFGVENLYFTLPCQYELIAFDNRNIEEAFSNTHAGTLINHFLKKHSTTKRNPKTKRLMIMELFDQIDPE